MALAISYVEKNEIVAERVAGMEYQAIGEKHHISSQTARKICAEMGLLTRRPRKIERRIP